MSDRAGEMAGHRQESDAEFRHAAFPHLFGLKPSKIQLPMQQRDEHEPGNGEGEEGAPEFHSIAAYRAGML